MSFFILFFWLLRRGFLLLHCMGFSLQWLHLVLEHGLQGVWAQYLWHLGSVPPQHVGS